MKFQELSLPPVDYEAAIFMASYEGRCTHIAREITKAGFSGRAIVFHCADAMTTEVRRHLEDLMELLDGRCEVVAVAARHAAEVISYARSTSWPSRLLIDTTCFNRENLFAFLWSTQMGMQAFPDVAFGYTPPVTYGSWLSARYERAHNIIGFGGSSTGKRGRHLICCVGFESERAIRVIQALEPSSVTLALGSTPTRQEFLARNRATVIDVLGSSNFEVCEINVVDPNECLKDLESIVARRSTDAIHIAPFNTKLSCLAVYALWLQKREIRIWNAQPRTYNIAGYSKGSGDSRYFAVKWR